MRIAKIIAGGLVVVATYNMGKIVGRIEVAKGVLDTAEEMWPGTKKFIAKRVSEKMINSIFDESKEEEESQQ